MPPAIFYPDPDASADAARAVCARCPVRAECAQHAAENREMHGVWGGQTAAERRNNRPSFDSAARPGPAPLVADCELTELVESLDPDRPAAGQLRKRLRVSVPTAYKVLGRARRLGLIEQRGRNLYPRADPEKSGA